MLLPQDQCRSVLRTKHHESQVSAASAALASRSSARFPRLSLSNAASRVPGPAAARHGQTRLSPLLRSRPAAPLRTPPGRPRSGPPPHQCPARVVAFARHASSKRRGGEGWHLGSGRRGLHSTMIRLCERARFPAPGGTLVLWTVLPSTPSSNFVPKYRTWCCRCCRLGVVDPGSYPQLRPLPLSPKSGLGARDLRWEGECKKRGAHKKMGPVRPIR